MNKLLENNSKERRFTFKKRERLCSKKRIDKLFSEGKSFLVHPLKFVYISSPISQKFPVQVAFSVGKKNFKHAVRRNFIKRKLRETYRLNKHLLYNALDKEHVAVFVIFIGKTVPDFKQVDDAMKKGINKLIKEFSLKKP